MVFRGAKDKKIGVKGVEIVIFLLPLLFENKKNLYRYERN